MLTPKQTAEKFITIGQNKTQTGALKTLLLGILAGMFIALAGVGSTMASAGFVSYSIKKLASACVFPAGLIMVVLAGSELFTGNNLIIISVLDKKVKVSSMLKNWGIVYLGNLIGSLLVAFLAVYPIAKSDETFSAALIASASAKTKLPILSMLFKGILCNFLVCIAVWMSNACDNAGGKAVACYFPIMLFVLCGFEHSVANMFYLPAGMIASYMTEVEGITLLSALKNLLFVTVGNIIGGAGFVGCAYYGAYLAKKKEEDVIKF